jgi:hypothetical protein
MIYKRVAARLRAQDWIAISIELAIVIVGVFIGTQVSNWNASRLERAETRRMLVQLQPELRGLIDFSQSARKYYGTTRRYAGVALAGWRADPNVSDSDFVIAAYQASQISGIATNNATWATIFGADRLRTIDDPTIRRDLASLMASDTSQIDLVAVDTPYRRNVRRIIPIDIQDSIRAACGDVPPADKPNLFLLPSNCPLAIAPKAAASAAQALRSHPDLANDLQWHVAAAAAFLASLRSFELTARSLQNEITASVQSD